MSLRTTAGLALLAAALAAYVYFVEIRGAREREEAEEAAKRVVAVDAESVVAVEVPLEEGGEARLVRDADAAESWRLEKPLAYPADAGVVSGILSALSELDSEATIDDPPEDLGPFGLAEGAQTVRIFVREGDPIVLELGGKAPIGALRYLRLGGESRIFTVEDWRLTTLRPRLTSLRDKRVTEREPADVTGVRIFDHATLLAHLVASGGESPEGDPAGRSWRIIEPIEDAADGRQVQRMLEDLHFMRAIDFVDEPGDLSAYGLHRPEVVIELQAGEAWEPIEFGRRGEKVYVRTARHPSLFQVSERALADVPRTLFAYREKQVLEIDEDRASRIELEFPREDEVRYAFRREENEWKAEEPEVEIGSLRIEDILYAIRDLEATGLEERSVELATLGLDPPGVRVRVLDTEGEELGWVALGDPTVEGGTPALSGQNDRVWRVANDIGKDVPLTLEAFRNNFLEEAPEPERDEPVPVVEEETAPPPDEG